MSPKTSAFGVAHGEVWKVGIEERQIRNAAAEKGHAEERTWRQGRDGQEPQAGDCDWLERSAEEGRESSAQTQVIAQAVTVYA
jgi:hypothetical protein